MAYIARCEICLRPVSVIVDGDFLLEVCPSCDIIPTTKITPEQEHDLEERCIRLYSALKGWV